MIRANAISCKESVMCLSPGLGPFSRGYMDGIPGSRTTRWLFQTIYANIVIFFRIMFNSPGDSPQFHGLKYIIFMKYGNIIGWKHIVNNQELFTLSGQRPILFRAADSYFGIMPRDILDIIDTFVCGGDYRNPAYSRDLLSIIDGLFYDAK